MQTVHRNLANIVLKYKQAKGQRSPDGETKLRQGCAFFIQ